MTKAGDCFVSLCVKLYDIPAAVLCVILFLTQAAILDYYLVQHLSKVHLSWITFDLFNLGLLICCIYHSHASKIKHTNSEKATYSFAWIAWLVINVSVAAKTITVFVEFAAELEEEHPSFFGPNTLKTVIALGSCVFLLLLATQHDAPLGSERRRFIDEMTCFVFIDLLDTADILEIFFESTDETFWKGLKEIILAVATLNLVIPTVPLLTLSRTRFGVNKLKRRWIYLHRMLVVLSVNVPNLLIRMNVWHGYNVAISPFTLKNIIMICITVYEFYLHKKGKYHEHEKERREDHSKNDRTIELGLAKCQNSALSVVVIGDTYEPNLVDNVRTEERIATHL